MGWTPRTGVLKLLSRLEMIKSNTCLVHDDNIRLEHQHDVEGDIDHPEAGTQRLTPAHDGPRQPVSDGDHLALAGDGLREGVAPVVVGRDDGGGVTLDLQREAAVHDQPLRSAYTEVRMYEHDPHHDTITLCLYFILCNFLLVLHL